MLANGLAVLAAVIPKHELVVAVCASDAVGPDGEKHLCVLAACAALRRVKIAPETL